MKRREECSSFVEMLLNSIVRQRSSNQSMTLGLINELFVDCRSVCLGNSNTSNILSDQLSIMSSKVETVIMLFKQKFSWEEITLSVALVSLRLNVARKIRLKIFVRSVCLFTDCTRLFLSLVFLLCFSFLLELRTTTKRTDNLNRRMLFKQLRINISSNRSFSHRHRSF